MRDFLQESYFAQRRSGGTEPDPPAARLEGLHAVVAGAGLPAHLVGSILVPADETLFLLWRADAETTVRELAGRAGIACDRVTEVRSWGWGPTNIKGFRDARTSR